MSRAARTWHDSPLGIAVLVMVAGQAPGCTRSESDAASSGATGVERGGAAGARVTGGSDAGRGNEAASGRAGSAASGGAEGGRGGAAGASASAGSGVAGAGGSVPAGAGNGGSPAGGGDLGGQVAAAGAGGSVPAGAGNGGSPAGGGDLGGQVAAAGAAGGSQGGAAAEPFITWTYGETPMGLFLPPPTGEPLPVVMYLHGCHNDPVYPTYWILSAVNAIEPCAVFLPTAPPAIDFTCADWGGTYDSGLRPNMVNALAELDRLIDEHGFDAHRQYLYGESMGGEGVFRLLADFPTRFAGAVSAAGYTLDVGASEMAQTPLWIFHGSADSISPVENDRAIYQSILDAGGTQVTYTEYPDLDHVPGIERARVEPGLFEWLLDQRRD